MCLPGGVGLTLYGHGLIDSVSLAADFLSSVRPQIVVLHGSAKSLISDGSKAHEMLRDIYEPDSIWWEIAGDMPSQVSLWSDACEAAASAGAYAMVLNTEGYWKKVPADRASEAVAGIASVRNKIMIGHSSFGWPTWVSGFGGGHEDYPWKEFLGIAGADFTLPQVYWGKVDQAPRGWVAEPSQGLRADRASRESYRQAVHKHMVRNNLATGVYLLAYSTHRWDAAQIALKYPCAVFWSSDRLEPHGRTAVAGLAELYRRGYWRDGGVRDFQQDSKLTEDNLMGPVTLGALGVVQ